MSQRTRRALLFTGHMALVLVTTACTAAPAGLTLFENGSTDMKIVLPVAATDAEKDAAGVPEVGHAAPGSDHAPPDTVNGDPPLGQADDDPGRRD